MTADKPTDSAAVDDVAGLIAQAMTLAKKLSKHVVRRKDGTSRPAALIVYEGADALARCATALAETQGWAEIAVATIVAHRPDASFDDSASGHAERQAMLANVAREVAAAMGDPATYERVEALRQDALRWRWQYGGAVTTSKKMMEVKRIDAEIAALSPAEREHLERP